jgi:copper chaperone NosL
MRRRNRIGIAAAAALLGLAYVAPLWHIGLEAPQYPEGIGMFVWIDTITGQKPNDLNSINGLNHYIGMKAIVPDTIPALRLMPRIVGGLIAFGLLVAGTGRRSLLLTWTALFGLAAIAGLVDFWYWGYDYGHDLDPAAAIKIPGFSYQPPVIGSKQLLNFTAHSWPGLGGWAIVLSFLAGITICAIELRRNRQRRAIAPSGVTCVPASQ